MSKFLTEFGIDDNLAIEAGGLKVKKAFDVEIFDEDYGFISIRVPEGYYTYRRLDFFGFKPTQIGFDLEMAIDNMWYKESGWLDIAGYFDEEYVDTENIYSVEVIINGVKEIKVKDVSQEEAYRCYYNVISNMQPEEGILKSVHLTDGGDDIDDYVCKHENDKYNIINLHTGTYMNKGYEPLNLDYMKLEDALDDIDGGEDFELLKALYEDEDFEFEEVEEE